MRQKRLICFIIVLVLLLTGCSETNVLNKSATKSKVSEKDTSKTGVSDNSTSDSSTPVIAKTEVYVPDDLIKEYMTLLASDDLKGRIVGSEENKDTSAYLAEKFKSFGLEPYAGESYFHEYTQELIPMDKQIHTLSVKFNDGKTKNCVYGEDFAVSSPVESLDITLPVTFDMKDSKLTEKIAVISDLKENGKIAKTSKCVLLKREIFPGSVPLAMQMKAQTTPTIQISEKLYEELSSRPVNSISIILRYPIEISDERNVVGRISGKDNKKAIIISAHFDHVGYRGKTIYNGAVDNASGTAVVLNLAKRLSEKAKEKPFIMDVIFACFNGEEAFLMGSDAFSSEIQNRYDEIYNINIDCVGKKDGGKLILGAEEGKSAKLKKDISPFLENRGIEYGVGIYGTSDHVSFSVLGYDAITLGQENIFTGSGAIHTPGDKIDNIDYDYLHKLSSAVCDFILSKR